MLFLHECGMGSQGRAVRIYRTYGADALEVIKANPYQLADGIRGIGFKTADQAAEKLGIARNSPLRARTAVRYTLVELSSQGHRGFPEAGLVEQTSKVLEFAAGGAPAAADRRGAGNSMGGRAAGNHAFGWPERSDPPSPPQQVAGHHRRSRRGQDDPGGRGILEIFAAKKVRCVLTAPTGRAAKRLSETTGQSAQTERRRRTPA